MTLALNRRAVIIAGAAAGGGLALRLSPAAASEAVHEFNPWLTIAPDGQVTLRVTMPEIGNGVGSQAALFVAEELGCDWRRMIVSYASPAREAQEKIGYGAAGGAVAWFGGRSMLPERMKLLQQIGASARERLKAVAAMRWKVPATEIEVTKGELVHAASQRRLGFGAVVADAAKIKLEIEPEPKPASAWTLIGKTGTPARLGLAEIVSGRTRYGIDVRVPGMVYAALRQSPVQGGRLRSFDAAAVRGMPGVIAVVEIKPGARADVAGREPMGGLPFNSIAQSAVAVVAEHYWQARKALEALPVEWDAGPGGAFADSAALYQAATAALDAGDAKSVLARGDAPAAGLKTVEATYRTPYCDHAPMEPLNATALVTEAGVEVWHGGQQPAQGLWVAADEAGVPLERALYHQTDVGGAFGRRIFGDDARMAVAVARQVPGRPVQLIWSREEMTQQGRYRPLVAARLTGSLDAQGKLVSIRGRVAQAAGFPTIGLTDSPYLGRLVPHVDVHAKTLDLHLLTGSFRGPSYSNYAFITESFIDECAHAAGADPLRYRLDLLADWPDAGWRRCLEVVAAKAGWGKPLPKGRGRGIAIANWGGFGRPQAGTTVATVAEVEVARDGELRVHRLDLAFDSGQVANRDNVAHQLIGATLFGASVALNEEIAIKDGAVIDGNFDAYTLLRMRDVPQVELHFDALSGHDRFGEIGEAGVGPAAGALANAIFAATGKRVRAQPLRKQDLSWS
ncbi:MAG: molybdopterin-dependent oxidoreductase [Sphingomonadaceae bacterium]|nr:molybdopterin-dependent oxidoreductase [Sphingomonadaceae bacterium]